MEDYIKANKGKSFSIVFTEELANNPEQLLNTVKKADLPNSHNILVFQITDSSTILVASFEELPLNHKELDGFLFVDLRTYPYKPMGSYNINTI